MYWYKSCPKCHGDLVLGRDYHGWYRQCVQCGLLEDLPGKQRPLLASVGIPERARPSHARRPEVLAGSATR